MSKDKIKKAESVLENFIVREDLESFEFPIKDKDTIITEMVNKVAFDTKVKGFGEIVAWTAVETEYLRGKVIESWVELIMGNMPKILSNARLWLCVVHHVKDYCKNGDTLQFKTIYDTYQKTGVLSDKDTFDIRGVLLSSPYKDIRFLGYRLREALWLPRLQSDENVKVVDATLTKRGQEDLDAILNYMNVVDKDDVGAIDKAIRFALNYCASRLKG